MMRNNYFCIQNMIFFKETMPKIHCSTKVNGNIKLCFEKINKNINQWQSKQLPNFLQNLK